MQNQVKSPLTGKMCDIVENFAIDTVIQKYKDDYQIDVSKYFADLDVLNLYQCEDTGYRFFYPNSLAGDGAFYHHLSAIDWYYAQKKWEYLEAKKYISEDEKVLDIGCGAGYFLELISDKTADLNGLELNEDAKNNAVAKGLNVSSDTIQEHAMSHSETYDTVTFFQVLEHIGDIYTFLEAAIKSTKIGGQIIIGVPNNNPYYLRYDREETLNLPPHHMGWWDENSLRNLAEVFAIKCNEVKTEPLQHINTYTNLYIENTFTDNTNIVRVLNPLIKPFIYLSKKNITGAGILAIYTRIE